MTNSAEMVDYSDVLPVDDLKPNTLYRSEQSKMLLAARHEFIARKLSPDYRQGGKICR